MCSVLTKEEKENIGKSIILLIDSYIDNHKDVNILKDDIYGYLKCLKDMKKLRSDFPIESSFSPTLYEDELYFIFHPDLLEFLVYEGSPVRKLDF